ncbi:MULTISPECIES: hypothetical protein [Burkholderia]|uniref:hypothetical protein n=1 Tax=Burkholderia TaxID=32008 RepID=UPI00117829B3|nr:MULTISPECIES: hypothetical protein [Burkholderia]EKS9798056.1 hypothetical protein [Burkholderia cepacia]EKS9805117.1 hypothetical protein [Burkholderia cepacia]EKS9812162.1 hypothetical protein [Burkholderia cepacia]EKS9821265.1 hypothetical protein [Burkholderia cepacia]EKS9829174.1 hypothetical protein [Burkholderia cepacia]
MPTIHPPSDSPSIGLLPAAKPGRHRHRINPNISFQIQLAIRIERIQFECKFIFFKESFRPARPGFAPKKNAPARSGNCQLSGRHLTFRMTTHRSLHGDVSGAAHLGADNSKEKILTSNFI